MATHANAVPLSRGESALADEENRQPVLAYLGLISERVSFLLVGQGSTLFFSLILRAGRPPLSSRRPSSLLPRL